MSLLPSEIKLLNNLINYFNKRGEGIEIPITSEEVMYTQELKQQGVISNFDSATECSNKLYEYLHSPRLPVIEELNPTPAELFARIRNYVVEQAGTKPLLQIMYDVYSWPEVQKNCGNKGWLADRQIELGLQVYLGKHRGEAFDFCTQDPNKSSDF